jgi:hypothetical protein
MHGPINVKSPINTIKWQMGFNSAFKGLKVDYHVTFRDLLHAVKLQHGTGGFTSPPKEGVLRIFSP